MILYCFILLEVVFAAARMVATVTDYATSLWKNDRAKYHAVNPNDQDCSISQSGNWKDA